MRKSATVGILALLLAGCAHGPVPRRADTRPPDDVAEGLQHYYDGRLLPADGGYSQGRDVYSSGSLPSFYDVQGATLSAAWAREANTFAWVGTGTGLALLAAGIGITAVSPSGDLGKNAWWLSLMPTILVGWTFHWVGDAWFRQPSVALYNKQLAEHLGMKVFPKDP